MNVSRNQRLATLNAEHFDEVNYQIINEKFMDNF